MAEYNTPTGYVVNRKNSFESAALQTQLKNRQTEQFLQVVEDNNELMMGRLARMMRDGNREMLEKFEDIMACREEKIEMKIGKQINAMEIMMTSWEDKMEKKIGNQINGMEEIITEKIISVIKDEDRELENKMSGAYKSELMSTKEEITSNTNMAVGRLDSRLTTLEVTHKEMATEVSTRLSVSSKKEEAHHMELLDNLSLMEELKSKVHSTGRRIEELSSSMTLEMSRNQENFDGKFEEIKGTMRATTNTLATVQSPLKQIETNAAAINEMQTAMTGMMDRLSTLEAEKLTNTERFTLQRARMDRLESSINTMDQSSRSEPNQNQHLNISL